MDHKFIFLSGSNLCQMFRKECEDLMQVGLKMLGELRGKRKRIICHHQQWYPSIVYGKKWAMDISHVSSSLVRFHRPTWTLSNHIMSLHFCFSRSSHLCFFLVIDMEKTSRVYEFADKLELNEMPRWSLKVKEKPSFLM